MFGTIENSTAGGNTPYVKPKVDLRELNNLSSRGEDDMYVSANKIRRDRQKTLNFGLIAC
jgi:hypothetical protein